MRKLLAILLLAVFGLPLVTPLLAWGADGDAGLPACCRRNGKHHCAMSLGESAGAAAERGPTVGTPPEKCPYCPPAVPSVHSNVIAGPSPRLAWHAFESYAAGAAQAECKRRISRDRSRLKRGPPAEELA